jgi:hypothetical protein
MGAHAFADAGHRYNDIHAILFWRFFGQRISDLFFGCKSLLVGD